MRGRATTYFCIIVLPILLLVSLPAQAQKFRKLHFTYFGGVSYFPGNPLTNAIGEDEAVFRDFGLAPTVGVGAMWDLSKHLSVGEELNMLFSARKSRALTMFDMGLNTVFKFNLVSTTRNFSPFIKAGVGPHFVYLSRPRYVNSVSTDPNANIIGPGISVTQVETNDESLNLGVMLLGGVIGGGFEFRLHKKTMGSVGWQTYWVSANNPKMEEFYPDNINPLMYSTVMVGITHRVYKPYKQLLAQIYRDSIFTDYAFTVEGYVRYKKKNPQQMDDKYDILLMDTAVKKEFKRTESDKFEYFTIKHITPADYKITLPGRERKIKNADIKILVEHISAVRVNAPILELEVMEEAETATLLSRDGNFNVVLREGFQHDVQVNAASKNITGKISLLDSHATAEDFMVILYRQQSPVDTVRPTKDGYFAFNDIVPGPYKVVFKRKGGGDADFTYAFTGDQPTITSQSNSTRSDKPLARYNVDGLVSTEAAGVPVEIDLINEYGQVVATTTSADGIFSFKDLPEGNYDVVYKTKQEDVQSKVKYTVTNGSAFVKDYSTDMSGLPPVSTESVMVTGNVTTVPATTDYSRTQVLLTTHDNKVVKKMYANPDGTFTFDNLPPDKYKVEYVPENKTSTGRVNYTISEIRGNVKIIKYPTLRATARKNTVIEFDNSSRVHYLPNDTNASADKPLELNKTYRYPDKLEMLINGWGNQIGAFFDEKSLFDYCQKATDAGVTDLYIQVVDDNTKPGRVIYRIIVGNFNDANEAFAKQEALKKLGYTCLIKRHLQ